MTTRISRVRALACQSSRNRPRRCRGAIGCHLCSSPSVCLVDPRAGPSFLSRLSGSWDPRKMSILQECLATVCLMCAHKSWARPGRGVGLRLLHAFRLGAHSFQAEGAEMGAAKTSAGDLGLNRSQGPGRKASGPVPSHDSMFTR